MIARDPTSPTTLCVVNEHAGAGAMADVFRRMEHRLEEVIGPFEVAFTDGPGHATELVRQGLRDGYQCILSGGGDGTLNECVNGFFDEHGHAIAPHARLGLLSGGTGGDFRKTLGLTGTDDALHALARGRTIRADVGLLTAADGKGGTLRRHFMNIASFGLSGLVDRNVPHFKQWGGKVAYFGATLMSLWAWKNPRVALTIDGEVLPPRPVVTVAVGNGRYFGGGMRVCPDARLDSGAFELTVLGDLTRLELMMLSRSIYEGRHVYDPKVLVRRGRLIEAIAEGSQPVHLDIDGEPLGQLPARFELLPGAIELIVP